MKKVRRVGHGTNVRARLDERERLFINEMKKLSTYTHTHTYIYTQKEEQRKEREQ
jgi:hypothetical protein